MGFHLDWPVVFAVALAVYYLWPPKKPWSSPPDASQAAVPPSPTDVVDDILADVEDQPIASFQFKSSVPQQTTTGTSTQAPMYPYTIITEDIAAAIRMNPEVDWISMYGEQARNVK